MNHFTVKNTDYKLNHKNKLGFNLAEVVVASAVIALMMVSLISYVQSAGELWKKSHTTITLVNNGNALLDFVEKELWAAEQITAPPIGSDAQQLTYTKVISDYQSSPASATLDFVIEYMPASFTVRARVVDSGTNCTYATGAGGWSVGTTHGPKKIVLSNYNFDVCRYVKDIGFARRDNHLLDVRAILSISVSDQEFPKELNIHRTIISP